MSKFHPKSLVVLAEFFLGVYVLFINQPAYYYAGWLLLACFVFVVLIFLQYVLLEVYAFTIAIFATVTLIVYYPQYFTKQAGFKLSNLMAPLMTSLFSESLACLSVIINFWWMVWDLMKIVILSIGAGLIFNYFMLIITIISAFERNDLLVVGPILILAVVVHNNIVGYFLGYWFSRSCRMWELRVGLQNGGLASSMVYGKMITMSRHQQ